MKRCLIIINPSSGKHIIQNKLDRIIGQLTLQNIVEHFEIFYTEKKDDAYYKTRDCDENQYDFIMSVGGFDGIIPFADINDGKLDLVIVKRCSVTDLIALIKDYRFGKHDKSPFIHYVQGQHIHITCDQDLTMDIDGEEGTHLPIDVHTLQKSIQLLVPLK